jgi:hypothetical protein
MLNNNILIDAINVAFPLFLSYFLRHVYLCTNMNGVTSQRAEFLILASIRTINLANIRQ